MLWQSGRRSSNIQDNRGVSKTALGGGGGLLLVGVVVALLGGDPTPFLMEGLNRTIQVHTQKSNIPKEEQDQMIDFISVVLAGTEDTWHKRFADNGGSYAEPQLVVFSGIVQSACGNAVSAMGPFYCSRDQTVYLDMEFFYDLKTRFGAPGDFAQAYVIAHEIGHHVQNQLGVLQHSSSNENSVRTELMADCLSGIWAHDAKNAGLLEQGDIEEALNAASQIGDDILQKRETGAVMPDSFTHGSSAQRYKWFKTGFDTGNVNACNTFQK